LESISYDSRVLAAIRNWQLGLIVTTEASKLPLQGLNFTTACLYVTTEAKIVSTAASILTTAARLFPLPMI
jgi:hypothetical protein